MSVVSDIHRLAARSVRFAAWDPLLTGARTAGLVRWGPTLSALVHASALRWPSRPAVIDDDGTLTYRQLDQQADRLAAGLRELPDGAIGLLCRNHRGFPLAQLAIERSGRNAVMLNTSLPASQLAQIAQREELAVVIADDEFADRLNGVPVQVVSADDPGAHSRATLAAWPRRRSRVVMLTSGTTGPPKGARQAEQRPSIGDAGLLDALPIRMNDTTLVASPLFHAWGLAHCNIALATGSTLVLQRTFDPGATFRSIASNDVSLVAVVPVMLSRLLAAAHPLLDVAGLRAVVCSGNVLSGTLANRWIERFGPHLYNVYGSTETAIATVATPQDLVNAPGTVGSAPAGVTVVILDDQNNPVAPGTIGRVFTSNSMQFDGYTDGTSRTRVGSFMATGDLGYLDVVGRLFVDGRENDLIVTGGENVFPSQVEEVLEQHPLVRQAAVVGSPDDEFGQRIAAFIVAEPGLDLDELNDWCNDLLAPFQRPRDLTLLDELPMTTTGKVLRRSLLTISL